MKRSWMVVGLAASVLTGCGDSNSSSTTTAAAAAGSGTTAAAVTTSANSTGPTQTIPVTRAQCTPFGNPPRPTQNLLAVTNTLLCAGGGQRLPDWKDATGTTRSACIYAPSAASTAKPLPLVFWLQGSMIPAEVQLPVTNVLSQLSTADLTGDPSRKGFILVELAGRITDHFYPAPDNTGASGWDNWDRQLYPDAPARTVNGKTYPMNLDAAAIDHYIAQVQAGGKVDPQRIYVMGWSNGAAMSILYAMNRPNVAAAAVYSPPNPYAAFSAPCTQEPVAGAPINDTQVQVFNPTVPIYTIVNDCDIFSLCPTAVALNNTLISTKAANMKFQIINQLQSPVNTCMSVCGSNPLGNDWTNLTQDENLGTGGIPATLGMTLGVADHLRWPTNWTSDYFAFLRDHPLGSH